MLSKNYDNSWNLEESTMVYVKMVSKLLWMRSYWKSNVLVLLCDRLPDSLEFNISCLRDIHNNKIIIIQLFRVQRIAFSTYFSLKYLDLILKPLTRHTSRRNQEVQKINYHRLFHQIIPSNYIISKIKCWKFINPFYVLELGLL